MTKPYIIGLKFGTWHSEVWFSGEDNEETAAKWNEAVDGLSAVGGRCANPNEFIEEACEHFEKFGFTRIQR